MNNIVEKWLFEFPKEVATAYRWGGQIYRCWCKIFSGFQAPKSLKSDSKNWKGALFETRCRRQLVDCIPQPRYISIQASSRCDKLKPSPNHVTLTLIFKKTNQLFPKFHQNPPIAIHKQAETAFEHVLLPPVTEANVVDVVGSVPGARGAGPG